MSNKITSFVVVLAKDYSEEGAQHVSDAIKMIKGVLSVHPESLSGADLIAEQRAKFNLKDKLYELIKTL